MPLVAFKKNAAAPLALTGPAATADDKLMVPVKDDDKILVSEKDYRGLVDRIDQLEKGQAQTNKKVQVLEKTTQSLFTNAFTMINATNQTAYENFLENKQNTKHLTFFNGTHVIALDDILQADAKALPGQAIVVESDDDDVPPAVSKAQPPMAKPSKKKAISSDIESDEDKKASAAAKRQKKQGDALDAQKKLLKEMMDFAKLSTGSQEILDKASALDSTLLIAAGTRLKPAVAKVFNANKAKAPLMNYCLPNPFKAASDAQCEKYLDFLQSNGFPRDIDFDGVGYDWTDHPDA